MTRDCESLSIGILKLGCVTLVVGLLLLTVALGTPSGGRIPRCSCAGLKIGVGLSDVLDPRLKGTM